MGLVISMSDSPFAQKKTYSDDDGEYTFTEDPTEVQMNYSNARVVMQRIGIPDGRYEFEMGTMDATEFLVRVIRAIHADVPDEGICATVNKIPDGPTVYDMGRREGYTNQRLMQMKDLAEKAICHNRFIGWA